jgi:hypothetical protein
LATKTLLHGVKQNRPDTTAKARQSGQKITASPRKDSIQRTFRGADRDGKGRRRRKGVNRARDDPSQVLRSNRVHLNVLSRSERRRWVRPLRSCSPHRATDFAEVTIHCKRSLTLCRRARTSPDACHSSPEATVRRKPGPSSREGRHWEGRPRPARDRSRRLAR